MSRSKSIELRRMRPLLGNYVEVRIRGLAPQAAANAIERAYRRIALVQRCMSAHDPASDLGLLYFAPCAQIVIVHPWTYEVLKAAMTLHRLSSGVFDVTVGANLERRGWLPDWRTGPDYRNSGGMGDIELLDRGRVRVRRSVRIDLGGIAKGFAVDQALAALETSGPAPAMSTRGATCASSARPTNRS